MTAKRGFYRSNKTNFYRHFLSGTAIALMLPVAAASSYAQDADDDDAFEFEEIVVTGTNIRGATVVGGAVLTIGKDALDKSGKLTAADYLRELPSNLAGGVGVSDEAQSGQDNGPAQANLTGGQGVNLRGLGALSTLVLVNGRRMATSGQFGDFVDILNVPNAAIDRVEVLQDGASAIYGSDAVGGVVNFVLKRQLDGAITSARTGTTTEGGGTEFSLSHVQGFNWDTGHAVIGVEYMHRDSVKMTSRDRYKNGTDFSSFGGVNWAASNFHVGTLPNIYAGTSGSSAPVAATVPAGTNASLTSADLLAASTDTFNIYEDADIIPEMERISLFGSFDQDFGDSVTLFGDFRYTDRKSDYNLGYAVLSEHTLNSSSPFFIADIDPTLLNGNGDIAFGRVMTDRLDIRESSVEHYSGQVGLRFDIVSDWTAEVVASYARDKQRRYREQLRNASGTADIMACALGSVAGDCATAGAIPYNPFSSDALTQAQLDQYYGFEDLTFDSKVVQLSAKADGTLFTLPAGDVKLAVGVDYREETIDGFLEFNTLSVATRSGPYEETKRDAVSFFGEAFIPVTEMIEVSVAGRYETFSGTGDYSTFDPKVGMNFRPAEGLRIHGSWGTSFHAPSMRFENDAPQPLPGGNAAFTLPVSYFGPCDSDLVDFNGIIGTPGTAGGLCSLSVIINSGGAGEGVLSPEQSETWTVGFDYEPESVPGLRLSASYFNIKVDDRIQRIQSGTLPAILEEYFATNGGGAFASALTPSTEALAQALMDNPKYLGTFGPPFGNSAADIQLIVNATQLNIASLKEKGFDFSISYDFAVGDDTMMGVFANGTYLTTYALQDAPGNAFVDVLGKYSSFGAPVALRSRQGVWAEHGAFDARVTMNYTDSYTCDTCYIAGTGGAPEVSATPVEIDSWVTFDLNVGWDLSDFGGIVDGTRLNFQVVNLFNNEAPLFDAGTPNNVTAAAYDPANATITGRSVALTLTKAW